MNTVKRAIQVAITSGLMVLGLGLVKDAQAANPDTMVVTVTPAGVNYAVSISSPFLAGYQFGQVGIGLTTVSTVAIQVTNAGNIVEYFSLGIVDFTGGGNAWSNNSASLNPGTTSYAMQGLFQAAQPGEAAFNGAANSIPEVISNTGANKWGQGTTKTNPLASANLWLRLGMPTGVTENGEHTLRLSINGQVN